MFASSRVLIWISSKQLEVENMQFSVFSECNFGRQVKIIARAFRMQFTCLYVHTFEYFYFKPKDATLQSISTWSQISYKKAHSFANIGKIFSKLSSLHIRIQNKWKLWILNMRCVVNIKYENCKIKTQVTFIFPAKVIRVVKKPQHFKQIIHGNVCPYANIWFDSCGTQVKKLGERKSCADAVNGFWNGKQQTLKTFSIILVAKSWIWKYLTKVNRDRIWKTHEKKIVSISI